MIKIAHRGNVAGPNPSRENDVDYILEALGLGHHVEADVWYRHGKFFLGHDRPSSQSVSMEFLERPRMIWHAKNIEALHEMLHNPKIHCFWHESDQVTLTSCNWVWKYPEVYEEGKLLGICSDWL